MNTNKVPKETLTKTWWKRRGCLLTVGLLCICVLTVILLLREECRAILRGITDKLVPDDSNSQTIYRMISLNCAGRPAAAAEALSWHPDIALMQEAGDSTAVSWTASAEYRTVTGNGLLLAIRSTLTDTIAIGGSGSGWLSGVFRLTGGREMAITNVHLKPPFSLPRFWRSEDRVAQALAQQLRATQLHAIMDAAVVAPATLRIIGGDFNASPADQMFDFMRPVFQDAYAVAGRDWGKTGPASFPAWRIDQFWCDQRIVLKSVTTRQAAETDHRAVVADYTLQSGD